MNYLQSWFQTCVNKKGWLYILAMWLFSRLTIIVAMQVITPLIFTNPVNPEWTPHDFPLDYVPGFIPKPSWELFSHWDGKWYHSIATKGYEYVNDGDEHSIAFFPLFPLVIRGVMTLGLPFEIAGTLVNNLAFLGAMAILYFWVEEQYGTNAARWAIALMAWCPYSLFGTVIYTEGLFLLLTTACLWTFHRHHYGWSAIWGAMATATRVPGICLLPALLFVAWKERRPLIAYVAALGVSGGLLLFSLYCYLQFGDALAFVHAQVGWEETSWLEILTDAVSTLDRDSILTLLTLIGVPYLFWRLRTRMPLGATTFGFCVMGLLLAAGATDSFYRFTYGIASLFLGSGILIARHPRWGYGIIGLFVPLLILDAVDFASWAWVQ